MGWKRLLISQPPVISLEIFSRIGASPSWSVPRAGASIPSLSHSHKKVPPYTQSAQPVGILLWKKCSTAEINFFLGMYLLVLAGSISDVKLNFTAVFSLQRKEAGQGSLPCLLYPSVRFLWLGGQEVSTLTGHKVLFISD